jgi:lysine-N-methylase
MDVAATLSCPEVARLCLTEDFELEVSERSASLGSHGWLSDETTGADEACPYRAHYELVQTALLRVLSQEGKSIEARLEALVSVAELVSAYFHEHTAGDVALLEEQLQSDFGAAFTPRARRTAGLDDVMALRVGQYFLDEHRVDGGTRLGRLVERIRRKYERSMSGTELGSLEDGEALAACGRRERVADASGGLLDARGQLRLYRARRAFMRLGHSRRIERYFTNYCLNYVVSEPYYRWPDLQHYARDLALCLAALRFLLFSHPGVCVPWGNVSEGAEPREIEGDAWSTAALDTAAIETFQALTRSVERTSLLDDLRKATRIDDTPGTIGLLGLVSA